MRVVSPSRTLGWLTACPVSKAVRRNRLGSVHIMPSLWGHVNARPWWYAVKRAMDDLYLNNGWLPFTQPHLSRPGNAFDVSGGSLQHRRQSRPPWINAWKPPMFPDIFHLRIVKGCLSFRSLTRDLAYGSSEPPRAGAGYDARNRYACR